METRLGDIIDDFCIKCKRLMNHAVVSILDGKPAKVRCRTCYNDHDYRHEQAPPPKVDPRKAALLLAKTQQAGLAAGTASAEAGLLEAADLDLAPVEAPLEVAAEMEMAEEPVPVKVKAKARGRK